MRSEVPASPTIAVQQLPSAYPSGDWPSLLRGFVPLTLPALRRGHDRDAEIYGCGIIHMLLLRFFVACPPLAAQGCAPARPRIRVPASQRPLAAPRSVLASAGTSDLLNQHHPTVPVHITSCSEKAKLRLAPCAPPGS